MKPEPSDRSADPTRSQPPPIAPSSPLPPAAPKPSLPSAGPRPVHAPDTARPRQQQARRNYDPGVNARASREHGRGRHGG